MNPNRSIVGSDLSREHDPEKAHVLAIAADLEETNAAGIRFMGNEALKAGTDPEEFESTVENVAMPEMYKDVMYDTGLDDPDSDLTVDGLVEEINKQQEQADRKYKFTSESYDKLRATER
jgi:hypothetical protein